MFSGGPAKDAGERFVLREPLTASREMPDTGPMVPGMTEPIRYDVTVTVAADNGSGPDPFQFAVAAKRAVTSRNISVMSAHTWGKIISIVAVETPDRSSAVAGASEALRRPVASSSR
jgi:hypothetical protein